MNWFDEQIRERIRKDEEVFEDSFLQIAGAVLGRKGASSADTGRSTREAIARILQYYHHKMPEIPDNIRDRDEQLEYVLRPLGIMTRNVALRDDWYRHAFGPMLGVLRDGGAMVALIPGHVSGYSYEDPSTGATVRLDRRSAALLETEALCFYRPLPQKRLGIPDLLLYMKDCISDNDLILIVLASVGVTLTGLAEPRLYRVITGPVLKSGSVSLLIGTAAFLFGAAFASQLIASVKNLLMQRLSAKTSLAVEAAVMMRIFSLPLSFFRKYASGELSSRAQSVNSLCSMLLDEILSAGLGSILSLVYITQIFRYAPLLVWPSLVIILVTIGVSLLSSYAQMRITSRRMELSAKENGMAYALVSGIRKIRLSGAEKRAFARWGNLYAQNVRLQYDPPAFLKYNGVIITGIGLVGNIVLYTMALKSGVDPSDYFAFTASYGRVMGAFNTLAGIALSTASIKPVLDMAETILQAEPEMNESKEMVHSLSGNIEMSHVSFRYEENTPYVIKDLSLKIREGEYVAIVGRTGCGKSTLIRLLLGFEKPEKGAVYYDGRDLATLDPRSVRKKMGVVTQNGDLFEGDIFSNIAITAPQLTLDQAWEAAEIAGIADDIRAMPMGMHTLISEGSGGISGGQKQRIMIARAVAPGPRILIFDEATSALDNKTQKKISDALDALHCTRLVIAHRLSTIRHCDRILVLDGGTIIEDGTYEDLIRKGGAFADLVERQRVDVGETQGEMLGSGEPDGNATAAGETMAGEPAKTEI